MAGSGLPVLVLSCFGLTIVSAVFPWVNAELILISFVAFAPSPPAVAALVVAATMGQMIGKCALYWVSRATPRPTSGRFADVVGRLHDRLAARPSRAMWLVLASATSGIPPFYLVTLAAGALKLSFPRYCAAGIVGRFVHFLLIATVPALVGQARW